MKGIEGPARANNSTHVFHQYTLKVPVERRGALQSHLAENGIPSMIYYPLPLYKQDAFSHFNPEDFSLPVTEALCESVISLPIHTEMESGDQKRVIDSVTSFFNEAAASVTK
jgi:dTDP-4-amino-4,6-dideoxygalactose transaminase